MDSSCTTTFSAKEPALGYYYQIIRGLVLLLSEKRMDHPELSFECLDDITIEDASEVDVYQTKLHIKKAQLSDRSPEFWKTIRVWSEGITNGMLKPEETVFTLITTATVSEESFIQFLASKNEEDQKKVLTSIKKISIETDNKANLAGYKAFCALKEEQKKSLIKNIQIIDSEVSIEDTLQELSNILELSAPSSSLDVFVDSIMGWWFFVSVKSLLDSSISRISKETVKNQIDSLRDKFRADALPDDFYEAVEVGDDELTESESKTHVKQLSLIEATKREKKSAISDYKRAYGQRSKWLKDGRVNQSEYDIFDASLYDEWKPRHGLMLDKSEGKSEAERKEAGHEFYRNFYVDPQHPLPAFKNKGLYITKGSYQMLSEKGTVGWHPDYETLLNNDETVE